MSRILSASSEGWGPIPIEDRLTVLKKDIRDCKLAAVTNPPVCGGQPIMILPGGGVRWHNAKALLSQEEVIELHASCRGPNSTIDVEEL